MKVTVYGPNLNDQSKGQFHVHAEGCQHDKHYGPGTKYGGARDDFVVDAAQRSDVVFDVYPPDQFDYDPVEDYAGYEADFHFAPCTKGLK